MGEPLNPSTRAVDFKLEAYRTLSYWRTFEADKPVRVLAVGETGSPLGLYVFDSDGNCVAHDDEVTARIRDDTIRDDTILDFVPARTGEYTLELKLLGSAENRGLLAVRQPPY
jgi:hypothetical protein